MANADIVFGIDLGTTYSCIAYVDEYGKAVVVPNVEGDHTTPSVVQFEGTNRIVGKEAKNNAVLFPDEVVEIVKRHMGTSDWVFTYQGVDYRPEEISSYILRKVVGDAEQYLRRSIKEVVITCPAYFGIAQREATARAGQIAGLTVREVINEPTAAAIMYGLQSEKDQVVLVFDLGFDTAGEDMANLKLDQLSVEARYILHADGIIVLLDPLQLDAIRQRLPGANLPVADPMARPNFIVERLRELFEEYYRLPGSRKIKTPVAFAFSKVDTLKPLLSPDSALLRASEHFGTLDLQDVQSVSTEIGNYVQAWINPGFYQDIDLKFAHYRFFGVSSLGRQPDANNRLVNVNPRRVEDPFLWLLYEFDLIPGKKGR